MFWTITALSFEAASKRIGSMIVNLLRLLVGFVFLSIFAWIYRGYLLPVDASGRTWLILVISGLVGFTFGDLCLFQSFVVIGARISMLLMALACLFYYGISKIMQTLISAVAISMVTRYFSIPFSFGRGFKLATFVIVPATIIDFTLKSLNILNDSQLYIYLGCYAGTLFWLVKDLMSNLSQQTGFQKS